MNKKKIKVVKQSAIKTVNDHKPPRAHSHRAAAREMVSTVTEWVSELKQRKAEETKIGLENLFGANRQTIES